MLSLNNVTLVGVDGGGWSPETLKAIKYSCRNVNFGKKIFLTSAPEKYNVDFCEIIKIDKLSYNELNRFSLTEAHKYIETEFMLGVHPDGFILNPDLWTDNFLKYDYIGAPWSNELIINYCKSNAILYEGLTNNKIIYQVGNGGFCLKSKKILKATIDLYEEKFVGLADDVLIGVVLRNKLEKMGIKFPDFVTAGKFSCEFPLVNGIRFNPLTSFGFHGKVYHPQLLKLLDEVTI